MLVNMNFLSDEVKAVGGAENWMAQQRLKEVYPELASLINKTVTVQFDSSDPKSAIVSLQFWGVLSEQKGLFRVMENYAHVLYFRLENVVSVVSSQITIK